MKYTTHKLPTAEVDQNSETSGQKFGEAGQELALERGESVEALQGNQEDSPNELEQELLWHVDGLVDELASDDKKTVADKIDGSKKVLKKLGDLENPDPASPDPASPSRGTAN